MFSFFIKAAYTIGFIIIALILLFSIIIIQKVKEKKQIQLEIETRLNEEKQKQQEREDIIKDIKARKDFYKRANCFTESQEYYISMLEEEISIIRNDFMELESKNDEIQEQLEECLDKIESLESKSIGQSEIVKLYDIKRIYPESDVK